MTLPRRIFRASLLAVLIVLGIVLLLILFREAGDGLPSHRFQRIRQWWLTRIARASGLIVNVRGAPHAGAALWVANHVSWLDIPVIGSVAPVGFLSKSEIRQWPVIGWLSEKGGTLFIKRGGKNASQDASEMISSHIRQGQNILVFPEGTTSDGRAVRRFHARLFAPALDHALMVQPVALRYLAANGILSEKAPFIDNQSFVSSLWAILGEKSTIAHVTFLPACNAADFGERRHLAKHTHAIISGNFTN